MMMTLAQLRDKPVAFKALIATIIAVVAINGVVAFGVLLWYISPFLMAGVIAFGVLYWLIYECIAEIDG